MTTRPRLDLADVVVELTTRHTHREHYTIRRGQTWYGENHVTTVPALLDQLDASDIPSAASEDGPRAGYASKPAARLDSLDCVHGIRRDADWWLDQLDQTSRGRDLAGIVRLLGSLHRGLDECEHRRAGCCQAHELERDLRSWWTQARIVTGWDSPPWRPDNTCPACEQRGTLRVRLVDQAGYCVECRETWDQSAIGVLAEHIRVESEAEREPRTPRVSCACPWPKPVVADLGRLCRWCGSARCVHAVEVRPVPREDEASALTSRSGRPAEAIRRDA